MSQLSLSSLSVFIFSTLQLTATLTNWNRGWKKAQLKFKLTRSISKFSQTLEKSIGVVKGVAIRWTQPKIRIHLGEGKVDHFAFLQQGSSCPWLKFIHYSIQTTVSQREFVFFSNPLSVSISKRTAKICWARTSWHSSISHETTPFNFKKSLLLSLSHIFVRLPCQNGLKPA